MGVGVLKAYALDIHLWMRGASSVPSSWAWCLPSQDSGANGHAHTSTTGDGEMDNDGQVS